MTLKEFVILLLSQEWLIPTVGIYYVVMISLNIYYKKFIKPSSPKEPKDTDIYSPTSDDDAPSLLAKYYDFLWKRFVYYWLIPKDPETPINEWRYRMLRSFMYKEFVTRMYWKILIKPRIKKVEPYFFYIPRKPTLWFPLLICIVCAYMIYLIYTR